MLNSSMLMARDRVGQLGRQRGWLNGISHLWKHPHSQATTPFSASSDWQYYVCSVAVCLYTGYIRMLFFFLHVMCTAILHGGVIYAFEYIRPQSYTTLKVSSFREEMHYRMCCTYSPCGRVLF